MKVVSVGKADWRPQLLNAVRTMWLITYKFDADKLYTIVSEDDPVTWYLATSPGIRSRLVVTFAIKCGEDSYVC